MFVDELNRNQLVELKQRYLIQLSDEGRLNEVLYNHPEMDKNSTGVSMGELANADKLISDDSIMEMYRHMVFTEDDFDGSKE